MIQTTERDEGGQYLVTTLAHSSGEWIRGQLTIGTDGANKGVNLNQALGSSISYMRRYALAAIVGVIQDDDDAHTSSGNGHNQARRDSAKDELIALQRAIQKGEDMLDLNDFERSNSRKKHLGNADLSKASIQDLEKFRKHLGDKWRKKVAADAAETLDGEIVEEAK